MINANNIMLSYAKILFKTNARLASNNVNFIIPQFVNIIKEENVNSKNIAANTTKKFVHFINNVGTV